MTREEAIKNVLELGTIKLELTYDRQAKQFVLAGKRIQAGPTTFGYLEVTMDSPILRMIEKL